MNRFDASEARPAATDGGTDTNAAAAHPWRAVADIPWRILHATVDPTALLGAREARLIHRRPGGQTWRVVHDGACYYVKTIGPAMTDRHGKGWNGRRRLRWALRPPTVARTGRIHHRMARRELSVPQLVLLATHGRGPNRHELIASEAVNGQPFSAVYQASNAERGDRLLDRVAEAMVALHDAGVQHGHMVPGHIFISDDHSRITFIDNDENQLRPRALNWRQRRYNLEQFTYRFIRSRRSHLARRLLREYMRRFGVTPSRQRRYRARVLSAVRRRLERDHLR